MLRYSRVANKRYDNYYHYRSYYNFMGRRMKICICKNVSDRQIREALDQGARTMRDINRELGVGSECGKCVCTTRQIIRTHEFEHLACEIIAA